MKNETPEQREKRLTRRRAYYQGHQEEVRERNRTYYREHRKEILENNKLWRKANPKQRVINQQAYNRRHPGNHSAWMRKKKYGITQDTFSKMLVDQRGACAACGTYNWGHQGPNVDHCHVTGIVRGLLCNKCNLILGLSGENPEKLRMLAAYLEKNT